MNNGKRSVAVVGAGLVGSLVSLYLAKRGYAVSVYERRSDMRKAKIVEGRSINLSLSNRGLRALHQAGLTDAIKGITIPMHGRIIHDLQGNLNFQPYGKEGQFINSVSRADLNTIVLNAAAKAGVNFFFDCKCTGLTEEGLLKFESPIRDSILPDQILGCDGAWSPLRESLRHSDRFNYSQKFIDHGYKEFHIPAGENGQFRIEKNALHIWPRQSFMMIALPNPDGSFTGTLFYPWEGTRSFASLQTDEQIRTFFETEFPDFVHLAPGYLNDFRANPTGSLATFECWPWTKSNVLLLGDAAHGVVPFYGQGMNAGFEDVRILDEMLTQFDDDWKVTLPAFQQTRKPDADAIARLALDNFTEMRDLVADHDFVLRKKIEAKLHSLFPDKWIPLYSMVTFHDEIRYSEALATGLRQKKIMDDVMRSHDIANQWQNLNFGDIVTRLNT